MAVEQIAELRVGGQLIDAEGDREIVGLHLLLEAALELQQGGVLDEEHRQSAEVTVAQGVADLAWLACVEDTGYVLGDRVDEGAETK